MIKFLYFVDTIERTDRGRKEALRSQGEDRVTLWITLITPKSMHIFELSVSEGWVHMCVEKGSWGTHSFEVYQEGRPTQCLFFLHFHDVTQVASIHNMMAPKMAIINNNSLTSFYILDQLLKKWKNIYNLNPQNLGIKEAQNQRNFGRHLT